MEIEMKISIFKRNGILKKYWGRDMKEIWKDIVGYEGLYKVSNLGRVKSLSRNFWNGVNWWKSKEKILKNNILSNYCIVYLYKNKKRKTKQVHRLVAQAFISNFNNKPEVNHIDGDKENNIVDNLEWCTHKENIQHAFKTGLKNSKHRQGTKSNLSKLNEKQVRIIKWLLNNSDLTQREIGEIFNVKVPCISNIKNNKTWKQLED